MDRKVKEEESIEFNKKKESEFIKEQLRLLAIETEKDKERCAIREREQSEDKLRNLFIKYEKCRTKSCLPAHIRRNSNFSLNSNFIKEFLYEKIEIIWTYFCLYKNVSIEFFGVFIAVQYLVFVMSNSRCFEI